MFYTVLHCRLAGGGPQTILINEEIIDPSDPTQIISGYFRNLFC